MTHVTNLLSIMDIYLRTRGDQINQGYRWVRLDDTSQMSPEPLIAQKPEAGRLIYAEDFALLIARAGSTLTLHITGLPVTTHSNRTRQNVQNVLVCVVPTSDERIVRGIAVAAIEGSLAAMVDRHISMIPTTPGFQVDPNGLRQTLSQLRAAEDRPPRMSARIETDTAAARQHLCDELYAYRLPQHNAYPVVITRHRPARLLTHAHVWRGLTSVQTESLPLPTSTMPAYFPSIIIRSQAGQSLFLPDQFASDLNLIMLGKHLHHRAQGQRWLDQMHRLLRQYETQFYVMLLTTSPIDATFKHLLTHASAAQQVVLIKHNQEAFLKALHLERIDSLTLLLIDRAGRIFWQGQGECNDNQIAALQARLSEQRG